MTSTFTTNLLLEKPATGDRSNTWGTMENSNNDTIDAKSCSYTSISTTGGTTTLLTAQEIVATISVSGTLTTDATILFSGRPGTWIINNATAGAHNVFVNVSGQAAVTIQQGEGTTIWCDGTKMNKANPSSSLTGNAVPVGSVIPYAGTTAPVKWFLCYGQLVSRTIYANLFAAVGITYGGGDGVTNFALPDLRGRATFGVDTMGGPAGGRLTGAYTGGLNAGSLGSVGGEQGHINTATEMPAHSHDLQNHTHNPPGGGAYWTSDSGSHFTTGTGTSTLQADAGPGPTPNFTGVAGGGFGHNNIPPGIALNYIIFAGV